MPSLIYIAALALQQAPVPPDTDILVTARDAAVGTRIGRHVAALSESVASDRPLARFHDPVCVLSVGLPPAANRAVEAEVRAVARSVALRTGDAGCAPNVTVMFVPDSQAAFARLSRSRPLPGQTTADVRRIRAQPRGTRVWIDRETRSRDGDRPAYSPDAPAILSTTMSSRLSLPVRSDIVAATLLIDRDRVAGVALGRVSAYVAYRALAGIALLPPVRRCSILAMFDPDGRDTVDGLSAFDRAYLDALYATRGDLPSAMQRTMIANRITGGADAIDPDACPASGGGGPRVLPAAS